MALFDRIVNFTLSAEGGLSNDPDDPAAKKPSPYFFNGSKNWHTNKGITYNTFEAASKVIPFDNNYHNFIVLPRSLWYKIAKKLYWDPLFLDELKNQSIANLIFSWFWGSGYNFRSPIQKLLKKYGINWDKNNYKSLVLNLNKLIDKYGSKKIYLALDRIYRNYLKSLKKSSKFLKGWLRRLDDLYQLNINDLDDHPGIKKNSLILSSLFLGSAFILGNEKI